jgi:hypothetical protein
MTSPQRPPRRIIIYKDKAQRVQENDSIVIYILSRALALGRLCFRVGKANIQKPQKNQTNSAKLNKKLLLNLNRHN